MSVLDKINQILTNINNNENCFLLEDTLLEESKIYLKEIAQKEIDINTFHLLFDFLFCLQIPSYLQTLSNINLNDQSQKYAENLNSSLILFRNIARFPHLQTLFTQQNLNTEKYANSINIIVNFDFNDDNNEEKNKNVEMKNIIEKSDENEDKNEDIFHPYQFFLKLVEILYDNFPLNPNANLILKTTVQLLSNSITQNQNNQHNFWNFAFPSFWRKVLYNKELFTPSLVLLFNILSQSKEKSEEFCNKGGELLIIIFDNISDNQMSKDNNEKPLPSFEWASYLIKLLVFNYGYLHKIFHKLADKNNKNNSEFCVITNHQLYLMKLIEALSDIEINQKKNNQSLLDEMTNSFLITHLFQIVTSIGVFSETDEKSFELKQREWETLISILHIFSYVTSFHFNVEMKNALYEDGLLEVTIKILQQIDSHKKAGDYLDGVKRVLVEIIANMCYKHKDCQDQIRKLNGLTTLLNQCNIDDKNPFIKEWAIFGIRNICEDNEENQQLIASLEAQGVANYPPEFDQMGLKLEVDGNRIKLRNKQM